MLILILPLPPSMLLLLILLLLLAPPLLIIIILMTVKVRESASSTTSLAAGSESGSGHHQGAPERVSRVRPAGSTVLLLLPFVVIGLNFNFAPLLPCFQYCYLYLLWFVWLILVQLWVAPTSSQEGAGPLWDWALPKLLPEPKEGACLLFGQIHLWSWLRGGIRWPGISYPCCPF